MFFSCSLYSLYPINNYKWNLFFFSLINWTARCKFFINIQYSMPHLIEQRCILFPLRVPENLIGAFQWEINCDTLFTNCSKLIPAVKHKIMCTLPGLGIHKHWDLMKLFKAIEMHERRLSRTTARAQRLHMTSSFCGPWSLKFLALTKSTGCH